MADTANPYGALDALSAQRIPQVPANMPPPWLSTAYASGDPATAQSAYAANAIIQALGGLGQGLVQAGGATRIPLSRGEVAAAGFAGLNKGLQDAASGYAGNQIFQNALQGQAADTTTKQVAAATGVRGFNLGNQALGIPPQNFGGQAAAPASTPMVNAAPKIYATGPNGPIQWNGSAWEPVR